METQERPVILSILAEIDIQNIYLYGCETFGKNASETFKAEVIFMIRALKNLYELHPECRFIPTKNRTYRNIIFGSYLIIYRITPSRIEVLKAISSRMSISKIRAARHIKI
ncbi:MAG: type II toxin-antitoxin system RelE/ParE family toxin [Bacteroidales bacterium]